IVVLSSALLSARRREPRVTTSKLRNWAIGARTSRMLGFRCGRAGLKVRRPKPALFWRSASGGAVDQIELKPILELVDARSVVVGVEGGVRHGAQLVDDLLGSDTDDARKRCDAERRDVGAEAAVQQQPAAHDEIGHQRER